MKNPLKLLLSLIASVLLTLSLPAHALDFKLANAHSDRGDGGYLANYQWATDPDLGDYWKAITIIGTDRSAWMPRDAPWATPIANTTTFGTSFAQAASLRFDWSYTSFDTDLSADSGGYILNGVSYTLNDPGQAKSSGTVELTLAAGDTFSWFVSSTDMLGGRATLALSNVLISAIPEPAPVLMLLAGLGMLGFIARGRKNN